MKVNDPTRKSRLTSCSWILVYVHNRNYSIYCQMDVIMSDKESNFDSSALSRVITHLMAHYNLQLKFGCNDVMRQELWMALWICVTNNVAHITCLAQLLSWLSVSDLAVNVSPTMDMIGSAHQLGWCPWGHWSEEEKSSKPRPLCIISTISLNVNTGSQCCQLAVYCLYIIVSAGTSSCWVLWTATTNSTNAIINLLHHHW